uniref:protein associated with UVRAG as autophagy enhancer isoform X2 n=1 Tax=Solea senegalensis TaxID=28829 RepID=UPI001CD8726C|nr:protein associated with UVRAG as autophagy enhancer isoform X2 [Solea senegalensis]
MGTFGGVASSLHRSTLIDWCLPESPLTSAGTHTHIQMSSTDRSHDHTSVSPQSISDEGHMRPSEDVDEEMFVLPRSSPVISRHRRHVHTFCRPSSVDVDTSSSLSGRDSNMVRCRDTSCPRSSLNHFLNSFFHLPFTGQQHETPPTAEGTGHRHRCSSNFPEFSAEIYKTCSELEKEMAHLVVVDMVLEVLESVKFTLSLEQQTTNTHTHEHTDSRRHANTFSVLSTDSGFEESGEVVKLMPPDSLRSAEWLAQQLVLEFRRAWLPSHEPRRGRQSLRSSLQELPGTGSVAARGGSISVRSRMRGTLSWTPPRFQILLNVQPTLRRSDVMASQHFLCAGCGTEVEPRYMKRLRYCEYLGRYFCECCHTGAEAVIPARVLSCWDFNSIDVTEVHWDVDRYPVSDFSKQLLDSVWSQPLFELSCVAEMLSSSSSSSGVKELDRFRVLLEQLLDVRKLLTHCRFSGRVTSELSQLPSHLLSERPPLVSMDDLQRLRRGQLMTLTRAVLQSALSHVEDCQLCLARGFICEFCRGGGVIFPFQSDTCSRCPVCKTCFHKVCLGEKSCPKCERVKSRRKVTEEKQENSAVM